MLLGFLAMTYALYDLPCDPSVTHCPSPRSGISRQSSCGNYVNKLSVDMAKFIVS